MVLILLIGTISFIGFSSTAIDLCQDSNHEFVINADQAYNNFHGVVTPDELKTHSLSKEKQGAIFNC
jgi:2-phosphoglycerate kinase